MTTPAYASAGDYDEHGQPVEPELTGQVRMAHRLVDRWAGRILHVHGIGWHVWDGRRWTFDDRGGAKRAVVDTLKAAHAEAFSDADLQRDVKRCDSASAIAGILDIASSFEALNSTVTQLDGDPNLLNVANGTLDLRTLELRPHNPADKLTKICAASYNPEASDATWQTFLARSLPDPEVRAFLQRYVGVALVGEVREHVLAILTGTGRNGKGVFYGAIASALGDYAKTAEPDLFMHRENAHPTGEMDLLGVRWCVVSESEQGRRLAEATVKRLTGGDRIRARRMRQDFVEFDPSHTAALITNHLPKVRGDDPALWARLRVVPFDVVIPKHEQDPELGKKLAAEVDGILSWCLEGWADYCDQGLAEPEAVTDATDAYQAESDAVARFIASECVTGIGLSALFAELWDAWERWRRDEGAEELSKTALGLAFDRRGYDQGRSRGGRTRRGIGLKSDDEDPS